MAWPADGFTQLKYQVQIIDELLKFGSVNATNWIGINDNVRSSYSGDDIASSDAAMNATRAIISSQIANKNILNPIIMELAKRGYNSKASSVEQALYDICDGMHAASSTIKSRAYSPGTPAPTVGNDGSGSAYRCLYDANGYLIENGYYAGSHTLMKCTADKNNVGVSQGEEQFTISEEQRAGVDNLDFGNGPSNSVVVNAIRSQSSVNLLRNPSFSSDNGGTGGTDLTFTYWDAPDLTNLYKDVATYHQNDPGSTTGTAVKFTDNNSLTQYLKAPSGSGSVLFNNSLSQPYFLVFRVYRDSSADGTVTIRLGSQTETYTVSSYTNAAWHDFYIGMSNSKGYYRNFREDYNNNGVRVSITWSGRSTGNLYIDDVILTQMSLWDYKPYVLLSGQDDYLVGDTIKYTDTPTNTGRIQSTIGRIYGISLPHTSSGETYSDA